MCPAGPRGQIAGSPSGPTPHSPAGRLTGCPSRGPQTVYHFDEQMIYRAECHTGECPLTSPAMGVGNLLIFLTSPGRIALSSLIVGEGKQRLI